MMPNYAKQMEDEQRKYQSIRDPFKLGRQVAQRRYGEIMSGIDARQAAAGQSYSDMYRAAKQAGLKEEASGAPKLSGGMGAQYSDLLSSAEMQQLGDIGKARTQEMLNMDVERQSAMSNAMLEGQQATQMELENRQAEFGIAQQKQAIIADKTLNKERKVEQLKALGVDTEGLDLSAPKKGWMKVFAGEADAGEVVGTVLTTAAVVAGGVMLLKSLPAIKAFGAKLFGAKAGAAGAAGGAKNFTPLVSNVPPVAIPKPPVTPLGGGAGGAGGGTPLGLPLPQPQAAPNVGGPIPDFINAAGQIQRGASADPSTQELLRRLAQLDAAEAAEIAARSGQLAPTIQTVSGQVIQQGARQAAQAGQSAKQIRNIIDAEYSPINPPSIQTFMQTLLQPLGLPAPQGRLPFNPGGRLPFSAFTGSANIVPSRFLKPTVRFGNLPNQSFFDLASQASGRGMLYNL